MFFRCSWLLGLSSMMSLTIFRMMHGFFSTDFSIWICSRSFNCEKDSDFDENIDLQMMSMCLMFRVWSSNFFFLDAFSEFKLRWHHGCRNVLKSSSLACIYVHIFSAFVLHRIWFLWCFCCCMSLRKSCGCCISFRCPRDVSSFGYETMITIFNWKFLQSMYGSDHCTFRSCFQTYL